MHLRKTLVEKLYMHFYHVLNSPEFVITSVLNVTVDSYNIRDVLNGLNLGLSNE